ncbi:MAG: tetratricopeptide repeat-containing glycosyltransferase family protein [Porticoccaceae bacterium]
MASAAADAQSADDPLKAALAAAARGEQASAIELLQGLVTADAQHAQAHNELGVIHYQNGDKAQAQRCFETATAIDPRYARAHTNLGSCHNDAGRNQDAIRCHEIAVELNPRLADAWNNLGKVWNELREFESSAYCYKRALTLGRNLRSLRGLAMAYRHAGRYVRAKRLLQEAIALDPDDVIAHFGLAPLHFYLEEYPQAVAEYEWRWRQPAMIEHQQHHAPLFAVPAYQGEDLRGKTLLLHTEQGFGDNLLFARFIQKVRPRVGRLVMWCWPGLVDLFRDNFPLDQVTGSLSDLPECDFQLPLLSIPRYFDPSLTTIRQFEPYLHARHNRDALPPSTESFLDVGLVWSCDDKGFDYSYKKLPLQLLAPLFDLPGIRWHSLQVGPDRAELEQAGVSGKMTDLGKNLTSFAATAEIVQQLDLVISVDTAVAHLAAAMGKPVWVALKKDPDWRWHAPDGRPLWYPQATPYIQVSRGDWTGVINRMRRDLLELVAARKGHEGTS